VHDAFEGTRGMDCEEKVHQLEERRAWVRANGLTNVVCRMCSL
jgi:hypothetical protein